MKQVFIITAVVVGLSALYNQNPPLAGAIAAILFIYAVNDSFGWAKEK